MRYDRDKLKWFAFEATLFIIASIAVGSIVFGFFTAILLIADKL